MSLLVTFLVGCLAWTLLEYLIHGLGHRRGSRTLIAREHRKHHADILYFTPLPTKIRGAVPLLAVAGGAVAAAGGLAHALAFTAAVAGGWATYEVVHQSIHVRGPRGPWSRWAARHHLQHHFAAPARNLGVTTPLWDLILRRRQRVERVRVPRRQLDSIPWLRAAVEGAASAPDWLADYEVQ